LIAFGETPSPLVIRATKFGAPPDLEPLDVTIEDPVLVITWSFAGSNRFEGYDILDPYLPARWSCYARQLSKVAEQAN
jgi:hypothetical protein